MAMAARSRRRRRRCSSDLAPGLTRRELGERIELFRTAMRSQAARSSRTRSCSATGPVVLGGVSQYVARVKCAMLAWVAAEDALQQLGRGVVPRVVVNVWGEGKASVEDVGYHAHNHTRRPSWSTLTRS